MSRFPTYAPSCLAVLVCAGLAGCSRTVDVSVDEFLVVVSDVGQDLPPGRVLARAGERGVREEVLGPGRHAIDRFDEHVERHPVIEIGSGSPKVENGGKTIPATLPQVGVVTALEGEPLPPGRYLADAGQRGVRRQVLTPGRYLLNPYAFSVEVHPTTIVPTGSVGVVTHLDGELSTDELAGPDQRGVQREVLHAGLHFLNPYEYSVSNIRVGYRELTFAGNHSIQFPSSDSNSIIAEVSLIWGLLAEDAPYLLKRYGAEKDIVERVIKPQVESIVRLKGSNLSSSDFMQGDARERFQDEVTAELKAALEQKNLRVLFALVRSIEVPDAVKKPLQLARLAEEETLTNLQLEETARVTATLNTLKGEVAVVAAVAQAETKQLVADEQARGDAVIATARAQTQLEVARLEAGVHRTKTDAAFELAKATAQAERMRGEALAEAQRRLVEALGGPESYRLWRLAQVVPAELTIDWRSPELPAPQSSK
jgi:regulator of protease activity HflC (stomatin/prohibitin superfamily)